jgi:H+/Cl- antiporter ClcA
MDSRRFFGDSITGTLTRLVLLSIVVGIIFSALGITPFNLFERLNHLFRRIMELSADTIRGALGYFLLGAMIVFPIWFLLRLFRRGRGPTP